MEESKSLKSHIYVFNTVCYTILHQIKGLYHLICMASLNYDKMWRHSTLSGCKYFKTCSIASYIKHFEL